MQRLYLYLLGRWHDFFERYRSFSVFLFVLVLIIVVDQIAYSLIPMEQFSFYDKLFQSPGQLSINYAPEVWLGLLSMVLGTLIIVISIASQSTPKLIDLYTNDQISLIYIWFITLASIQNIGFQKYIIDINAYYVDAAIINTYVFLPIAMILALPYIMYILRYTKPQNVIEKIFKESERRIKLLKMPVLQTVLDKPRHVERYQYKLFDGLNQLDDLLEYVTFKEPKGDIIDQIGRMITEYIPAKSYINNNFFKLSPRVKNDISFKTMTGQFKDLEKSHTFFEQKAFRLLSNAYYKLIEKNDFDLASLCVSKLAECGKAAVDSNDDRLIDVVIIRFNTMLRFGIKHGLRNKEVRNIYNSLFHYSTFLQYLITAQKKSFILQTCNFFKIYGTETFKHSQSDPSFAFLVDVFALEMKEALISLNQQNYPIEFQEKVLGILLELDNPPDFDRDNLGQARIINDGVRVLQVGLCLYYLKVDQFALAAKIIDDIMEDFKYLGQNLKIAVESTCNKLKVFTPTFWEDTDRGNSNLYYVEEKEMVPHFLDLFYKKYDELVAELNK